MDNGKTVTLIGAGVIGSQTALHLARMTEVGRLILVDFDIYDAGNVWSQSITRHDVGRKKVVALARQLRRINPRLKVVPIDRAVEDIAMGRLRADVMLAALDSLEARRHVHDVAWTLGVPVVDAGVQGDALLARVTVFWPSPEAACLECSWSRDDYAALEQTYACASGTSGRRRAAAPATNATSFLGGLAASLQALECWKVLTGRVDEVAIGSEVLLECRRHHHSYSTHRRRADCLSQHRTPQITPLAKRAADVTVATALALPAPGNAPGAAPAPGNVPGAASSPGNAPGAAPARGDVHDAAQAPAPGDAATGLILEGYPFCLRLRCEAGHTRNFVHIESRLRDAQRRCPVCRQRMLASGFDLVDRLGEDIVPPNVLALSLAQLGFRHGDIFSIDAPTGESHYEIRGG